MLCGLPGAGKDYYIENILKKREGTFVASSDKIRGELFNSEEFQGDPERVFSLMKERTLRELNKGNDVIYNATNMTRKNRWSILSILPAFVNKECHIVWASIDRCIAQDQQRNRHVGEDVIKRMAHRFQAPYYDEGFDKIVIYKTLGFDWCAYKEKCVNDLHISHDNPHHTYGVYEHCMAAKEYIEEKTSDTDLVYATMYHDIGKPLTKCFVDRDGNPTEIAHYYDHQCVGAWMSYGLLGITPRIAWLICNHMEPFFNSKYYNNLPECLKRDIDLIHEADLAGH